MSLPNKDGMVLTALEPSGPEFWSSQVSRRVSFSAKEAVITRAAKSMTSHQYGQRDFPRLSGVPYWDHLSLGPGNTRSSMDTRSLKLCSARPLRDGETRDITVGRPLGVWL